MRIFTTIQSAVSRLSQTHITVHYLSRYLIRQGPSSSPMATTTGAACKVCSARKASRPARSNRVRRSLFNPQVKCDRRPGGCLQCERLMVDCIAANGDVYTLGNQARQSLTERPPKRKRAYRSCNRCRISKLKCCGQQPCERCSKRSLACVYDSDSTPAWVRAIERENEECADANASQRVDVANEGQSTSATANERPLHKARGRNVAPVPLSIITSQDPW